MLDLAAARRSMVDGQIRTADVTDLRIQDAMLEVPRERFVPGNLMDLAYLDRDLPATDASEGNAARYLLKPMTLAKLIQAARVGPSDRVLDVGCAGGYSTAILSRIAGSVVGLEEDATLERRARDLAPRFGAGTVEVVKGPLTDGWAKGSPYDVIILQGATEVVPTALCKQLADGGRLVCVEGSGAASKAVLYRMDMGEISRRAIFDAWAPVLPGFVAPPTFVF